MLQVWGLFVNTHSVRAPQWVALGAGLLGSGLGGTERCGVQKEAVTDCGFSRSQRPQEVQAHRQARREEERGQDQEGGPPQDQAGGLQQQEEEVLGRSCVCLSVSHSQSFFPPSVNASHA